MENHKGWSWGAFFMLKVISIHCYLMPETDRCPRGLHFSMTVLWIDWAERKTSEWTDSKPTQFFAHLEKLNDLLFIAMYFNPKYLGFIIS